MQSLILSCSMSCSSWSFFRETHQMGTVRVVSMGYFWNSNVPMQNKCKTISYLKIGFANGGGLSHPLTWTEENKTEHCNMQHMHNDRRCYRYWHTPFTATKRLMLNVYGSSWRKYGRGTGSWNDNKIILRKLSTHLCQNLKSEGRVHGGRKVYLNSIFASGSQGLSDSCW